MRTAVLLLLAACAPKPPLPPPVVEAPPPVYVPVPPETLAPRAFSPPTVAWGAVGPARLAVVENHEVPFVTVEIAFPAGAAAVPADKTGLAGATMDMLNEGAGKRDALEISAELRRLGASLGTGAGFDGSSVTVTCLRSKLEPTLDVLADVLLRPTFPADEWDRRRALWVDDLEARRSDPSRIADDVSSRLLWGDAYRGRLATKASLARIGTQDMRAWHKANVTLSGALVLVGGDITLAEVQPLLAARLAGLKGPAPKLPPRPTPPAPPERTTVFLVDKPGAAQSVVRANIYVGQPTDADYPALVVANMAIGGQFASRINLNLREQKGYTYGARTGVGYDLAGLSWSFSSGIHTEKTGPALEALFGELREVRAGRPLTEAEAAQGVGALAGGWPLRFETPAYLLGQLDTMRTYGLPEDWVSGYLDRTRAVTAATAQAAWTRRIDPDRLSFVVVGDAARVRPDIEALGLLVVPVDVDGTKIGAN
jgi:zinc protease